MLQFDNHFTFKDDGTLVGCGGRFENVASPIDITDVANKSYVDSKTSDSVTLSNELPWLHGQYNETYAVPSSGSGLL